MRAIYCLIFILSLTGCAQLQTCQQLNMAKATFAEGNYHEAFHELLPLAANGNAQAQYAVGYMYYYGFGVPLDSESGLFWIKQAAKQNNEPARIALRKLQPGNLY